MADDEDDTQTKQGSITDAGHRMPNGRADDGGFALLEAHHVDSLVDATRSLNRSVVHLDQTFQKLIATKIEETRVLDFAAGTVKRIEESVAEFIAAAAKHFEAIEARLPQLRKAKPIRARARVAR